MPCTNNNYCTTFAVSGKVERSLFTSTDRPESVCNCCVIEAFGGVFCIVTLLFRLFCRCSGFCHRTELDLFLFSYFKNRLSIGLSLSTGEGQIIGRISRFSLIL